MFKTKNVLYIVTSNKIIQFFKYINITHKNTRI